MFTKSEWERYKEIGKTENPADVDISSGYVMFGSYGMSINKYSKGKWKRKTVNDWRSKAYKQVNDEIKEMEWEEVKCNI